MSRALTAVILAGGKGRRLGGLDKGKIRLGKHRMIDIIAERLERQGAALQISGPHDYGLGVDIIPDRSDGPKGPVAGVYAAYRALENSQESGFVTLPVDGPNLPEDLLSRLYDAEASAFAKDDVGLHRAFAWWRMNDLRGVWPKLDFSQSVSLTRLSELTQARHITWVGDRFFANINTADDLAEYLSQS